MPAAEPMPSPEPMMAASADKPFDDDAWAFEPKWDGVRAVAICEGGAATRLISRNHHDVTIAYPELRDIHEKLAAHDAMVDGEIVALENGRPSFELLQTRMHVRNERQIARLAAQTPVTYVAFDLLYLDGRSLVRESFQKRRELLEKTINPDDWLQVSPSVKGVGISLFEAARASNLEGIIAKKLVSVYEPGKRSRSWLKIKTVLEAELVIAGWVPGEGRRSGVVGSLVLGVFDDSQARFRFVGSVGTGFTDPMLAMLRDRLKPLARTDLPFPHTTINQLPRNVHRANWVEPELVARVEFRELTSVYSLRAPSFKGLRPDKTPSECTLEALKAAAGQADEARR
jgi:bifunctional non-homologous end joining protein LigD